jgi:hypothetical protein
MATSLDSLDDHVSDIVATRRLTQEARFKPLPPGVERIDAVLRQALDHLAQALADEGFKPAYSRMALTRRLGPLTQTITLDTVPGNLSGVNVQVTAHASVSAASYKRWREEHGTGHGSPYLWIRQLGYLGAEHDYLKWQLVDPAARVGELDHLLGKIRELALPAFEAWRDKPSIAQAVFRQREGERIDWLMQVALWAGSPAAAARLIARHLRTCPKDVQDYRTELLRFQGNPGIPAPERRPASGAAFLVARHALDVGAATDAIDGGA